MPLLAAIASGLGAGLTETAKTGLEYLKEQRLLEAKQVLEDRKYVRDRADKTADTAEERAYKEGQETQKLQRETTWTQAPGMPEGVFQSGSGKIEDTRIKSALARAGYGGLTDYQQESLDARRATSFGTQLKTITGYDPLNPATADLYGAASSHYADPDLQDMPVPQAAVEATRRGKADLEGEKARTKAEKDAAPGLLDKLQTWWTGDQPAAPAAKGAPTTDSTSNPFQPDPAPAPGAKPKTVSRADMDAAARAAGVDPDLFAAVIGRESSGGRTDLVSSAGAVGPGQLMPAAAKDMKVDRYDPQDNLRGSALYLRQQLDAVGGDEAKALARYNAGPAAMDRRGNDISKAEAETKTYVARIMGDLAQARGAKKGEAPGNAGQAASRMAVEAGPSVADRIGVPTATRAEIEAAARAKAAPPPAKSQPLTQAEQATLEKGLRMGYPEDQLRAGIMASRKGAPGPAGQGAAQPRASAPVAPRSEPPPAAPKADPAPYGKDASTIMGNVGASLLSQVAGAGGQALDASRRATTSAIEAAAPVAKAAADKAVEAMDAGRAYLDRRAERVIKDPDAALSEVYAAAAQRGSGLGAVVQWAEDRARADSTFMRRLSPEYRALLERIRNGSVR